MASETIAEPSLSLCELVEKIDKNSNTDAKDWDAFEAELTRLISLDEEKEKDQAFEDLCLPLKEGPVPPVSIYRKILENYPESDFLLHGDMGLTSVIAEMLKVIVENSNEEDGNASGCYTMEHFFILCRGGITEDDCYVENEYSRECYKLSLLGMVCELGSMETTEQAERLCSILMQLVNKFPTVLWNEIAVHGGDFGNIETSAWTCVKQFFAKMLRKNKIAVEEKKRLLVAYYFPLKQSNEKHNKEQRAPSKDPIEAFMKQHGMVAPSEGVDEE